MHTVQHNYLSVADLDNDKNQRYLESNEVPSIFQQAKTTKAEIERTLEYPYTNIKSNSGGEYSIMNFDNFRVNKTEIKKFLIIHLNIDIDTQKGLDKLNARFQDAIQLCEERYLRKVPSSIKKEKISKNNIVSILGKTGAKRNGVYYCILSKILFGITYSLNDVRISGIRSIHEDIDSEVKKIFNITGDINIHTKTGEYNVNNTTYPIKYYNRPKSLNSVAGKMIGNIDYKSIDNFYDLHGFTIEFQTQEIVPILLILQEYYILWKDKAKFFEIENKELIGLSDLRAIKNQLDDEFYSFLYYEIKKSENKSKEKKEGGKGVSKKYKDIKIKAILPSRDPRGKDFPDVYSGTELKVVQSDNTNEKGLAFHSIFDYKKRFREINRLGSYIRQKDIINFVNDFFENLDDNLKGKGIDKYNYYQELYNDLFAEGSITGTDFDIWNQNVEKRLAVGLYKHFEKSLIKVKNSKKSKKHYYVHPYYRKDVEMGIKPELYEV